MKIVFTLTAFLLASPVYAQLHVINSPSKTSSGNSYVACGLSGTIDEKIADCAEVHKSRGDFALVSRLANGVSIHMDKVLGILWSSELGTRLNWQRAIEKCQSTENEMFKIGFNQLNWRLPKAEQYLLSEERHITDYLLGRSSVLWTSTAPINGYGVVFETYEYPATIDTAFDTFGADVRCVATVKN